MQSHAFFVSHLDIVFVDLRVNFALSSAENKVNFPIFASSVCHLLTVFNYL